MQAEWLARVPADFIASEPRLLLLKYGFIDDDGKPVRGQKDAIGIPFPQFSSYRASQFREAVDRVPGLHHSTYAGHTQMIYVGWSKQAVQAAGRGRAEQEAAEMDAATEKRQKERDTRHQRYLDEFVDADDDVVDISGLYMVDCEDIEDEWPDLTDNMTLSVRETGALGVFKADFDFGMYEGVMMISADQDALAPFMAEADESDSEDDGRREVAGGKKRTAAKSGKAARSSKKKKTKPTVFHLCMRGQETGEGEIFSQPKRGTLTFDTTGYCALNGRVSVPYVGNAVEFRARKVSDSPTRLRHMWDEFSPSAYGYARAGRWR